MRNKVAYQTIFSNLFHKLEKIGVFINSEQSVTTKMSTLETKDYKTFTINGEEATFSQIDRALPGDEVEFINDKWTPVKRAQYPLIVGIIDLKSPYVYGMSSKGTKQYLFTPYNESYPPFIVGCSERDRTANKILLVQFSHWEKGQKFPHANLVQTLGLSGEFLAEAKALYWQYSPKQLKKYETPFPPTTYNRIDISDKPTLNIDPPGCKDIDDILTIYEDETTKKQMLVITISDVAESIQPGTDLDIHASQVGQSLYSAFLPPRNMLPTQLSEGALSLLPDQKRLGISLFVEIPTTTTTKTVPTHYFAQTIIQNQCTYTYESIFTAAPKLVNMIQQAAAALGCDEKDKDDPHKWIETFMVFYNTEVAKLLAAHKVGIFRGQNESTKVERYKKICPELANEAAEFTSYEDIRPHFSLGLEKYCYASSPIRRYVDILNQRCLKRILLSQKQENQQNISIETANALQKQAKCHSRDDFFLSKLTKTTHVVEGIVFSCEPTSPSPSEQKAKIYIPEWKRIISVRENLKQDEKVTIKYFYNPNKVAWKKRIVFEVCFPSPV